MTLYCPNCSSGLGEPIEMEEAESGFSETIFRCPRCLHMRRVSSHLFRMDDVEDVSLADLQEGKRDKGSSKLKTAAKLVGLGLIGAAVLGAIASKKSDGGES